MTRAEKIAKLANAIRAYRGMTKTPAGANEVKWHIPPNPDKLEAILTWTGRLGIDQNDALRKIHAFKHYDEFNAWILTLDTNTA